MYDDLSLVERKRFARGCCSITTWDVCRCCVEMAGNLLLLHLIGEMTRGCKESLAILQTKSWSWDEYR